MKFNKKIFEAIDKGDAPNLFHSDKEKKYKPSLDVEKLMPSLSQKESNYIETVTSASYKKAIERLRNYTGLNPARTGLPQLLTVAMSAIPKIQQVQHAHKQHLEKLAVDTVLSLPEFEFFKHMIDRGQLKIVAKLEQADLSNAITKEDLENKEEEPEEGELTNAEEITLNLAVDLGDASDDKLKWKFANMLKQGNAFNKTYLFNMVSDELNKIDPNLVKLYGTLSSVIQVAYYAMPDIPLNMRSSESEMGSSEVVPEDDIYTVYALSPFFPVLIHEIVKGLWTYLTMSLVGQGEHDERTIDDETVELMTGPELYAKFVEFIPFKDSKYLPQTVMQLIKTNKIADVLGGGDKAKSAVYTALDQVKQIMAEYEDQMDDFNGDKYKDIE
jgi:hypothetical protein